MQFKVLISALEGLLKSTWIYPQPLWVLYGILGRGGLSCMVFHRRSEEKQRQGFSLVTPSLWNSLPQEVCCVPPFFILSLPEAPFTVSCLAFPGECLVSYCALFCLIFTILFLLYCFVVVLLLDCCILKQQF